MIERPVALWAADDRAGRVRRALPGTGRVTEPELPKLMLREGAAAPMPVTVVRDSLDARTLAA